MNKKAHASWLAMYSHVKTFYIIYGIINLAGYLDCLSELHRLKFEATRQAELNKFVQDFAIKNGYGKLSPYDRDWETC